MHSLFKNKIVTSAAMIACALSFSACSGSSGASKDPESNRSVDTVFTIHDESKLIGGPIAQGRVGDILLENDKIRVIIQKPRKNSGINSFGGAIIDADYVRNGGRGNDNFGSLFPLVNVEWSVNYRNFEVISEGKNGSAKVLRAFGVIDTYDYLDLDFIGEVAEGLTGQKITFPNRFEDRRNPFDIYDDLKKVSYDVVTEYTLAPAANYLKIETTYSNNGDEEVKMPVGLFINGSGANSLLIPKVGFSPDLLTQVGTNTSAVILAAYDSSDVSYGYFFDPTQFTKAGSDELAITTSVSFSGLTGLLFGEEFLKLAPLGGGEPTVNFVIPANGSRKVTGYFVVGNGSAGSVMDAGLSAIGVKTRKISGTVKYADGSAVYSGTVAVMAKGKTFITYRTDKNGVFSGNLPFASDDIASVFSDGKYKLVVEKEGYHQNGTTDAGICDPAEVNMALADTIQVKCTLGESGKVEVSAPVIDDETGEAMPARLTIVGEDPSPNKVGTAGRFKCTVNWEPLFGIYDVKYITYDGNFDLTEQNYFNLEPGTYRFMVSRGPEYVPFEVVQEIKAGEVFKLPELRLKRAARTKGYIGVDTHLHSISSPDSTMPYELRILSAAGEGLDILQSTDHDFITDYSRYIQGAISKGLIGPASLKTSAGDEITPNHYGHTQAYPLTPKNEDPEGGSVDWSASLLDEVSPSPDYVLPLEDLIAKVREDEGEEVIQINHIMDSPTGLLVASGWVTTPFYAEKFGVTPFMSYADPVERRMPPRKSGTGFPVAFGDSGLVSLDYDAIELTIGQHMYKPDMLFKSALPSWFNLLNLGLILTATAGSDSHIIVSHPVGLPRNLVASSVDPRDGVGGDHSSIDLEEFARNVKAHKVTVSAGPVVVMTATGDSGTTATVGDTIKAGKVKFRVDVQAPSWGWFDTIDIFANTEPIPADDETDTPMKGTAEDPAKFFKAYHIPRYTYGPTKSFSISEGTLESWKEEDGVITATVEFEMELSEDTWVVALARGTQRTKGYRSTFPFTTNVLKKSTETPEVFDPTNLADFHADEKVSAPAWGFTNPIFVDVDGDGFTAKYIREGLSPLGK